MSRTFRRVKHAYDFYGYNRKSTWILQFNNYKQDCNAVMQDCIKYFSDNYKANSRMLLNKTSRKMMRAESRNSLKLELEKYKNTSNWDNYSYSNYNRYSDVWSYT
jgi:hypothetical protein